jgi:hypothetical protein
LAVAWGRVQRTLASIPDANQSDIGSQHTPDELSTEFALREALLAALENQYIALWELATAADRYIHGNPGVKQLLDEFNLLADPPYAIYTDDEDFFLYPYHWFGPGFHYIPSSLLALRGWYRRYTPGGLSGLPMYRQEAMVFIRNHIEALLRHPDSDALAPYIAYLTELLRTIELEDLAEPYIRLAGGMTYAHDS